MELHDISREYHLGAETPHLCDGPVREIGYRIPDLHSHSSHARELYLHPKVFRMVELIYGAPATVYAYVVGRKYPMPGIAGGKNGMPNEMRCRVGSKHEFVAEYQFIRAEATGTTRACRRAASV